MPSYRVPGPNLLFLRRPRPTEDVGHRVVAFVAGVLKKLIAGLANQRHGDGPWPDPRFGIVHRGFILQGVLCRSRKTLRNFQRFAVITGVAGIACAVRSLSLIHISEPTRLLSISYA